MQPWVFLVSWRAETKHQGQWVRATEVFATEREGIEAARASFENYTKCVDHRAVEVREPVTHYCQKGFILPVKSFADEKEMALA